MLDAKHAVESQRPVHAVLSEAEFVLLIFYCCYPCWVITLNSSSLIRLPFLSTRPKSICL